MNVRISPRGAPQRTDLYGGVARVSADGESLRLWRSAVDVTVLELRRVAAIALDDEPGDFF